ncbi:hypothetical protein J8J40_34295, partial [Mycobacterium tuberculosis]|nr:hypothetical protein [Mycobacterium tuberculosis]
MTLAAVPDGLEALVAGDLGRDLGARPDGRPGLVVVLRDSGRLRDMERALAFFAPDVEVVSFPAWDCQPYD